LLPGRRQSKRGRGRVSKQRSRTRNMKGERGKGRWDASNVNTAARRKKISQTRDTGEKGAFRKERKQTMGGGMVEERIYKKFRRQ